MGRHYSVSAPHKLNDSVPPSSPPPSLLSRSLPPSGRRVRGREAVQEGYGKPRRWEGTGDTIALIAARICPEI